MIKNIIHKVPGTTMFAFMSEFRKLDNEIQAQTVQTFLAIAMDKRKNVPMQDLAAIIGISQASASRNVSFFSNKHKKHKGINLLSSSEDPEERRRKLVTLTNKGKAFYTNLENIWIS